MLFPYELHTKTENQTVYIWDFIRKGWFVCTPEERVRQGLLRYLVEAKGVSPAVIAVEREIKYYTRRKRFDVVVFGQNGKPMLLCECKAPEVVINQAVAYQIGRYNHILNAPYLLLTNGLQLFFYEVDAEGNMTQAVW